jgi:DNA modification methylase
MTDKQTVPIGEAKGRPMLHWVGKRPLDYVTAFPAQTVETFGPTGEHSEAQGLLFHGDNKDVLAWLLAHGYRGKVDLIYIDPPFDSGADYVRQVQLRGVKGTAKLAGEAHALGEQIQYTDIWTNDTYLQFMYERLLLLKELLAEDGSIYLHCDWRKGHHLRCLMDEVFGAENLLNEIVWKRTSARSDSRTFNHIHDLLFLYSKTNSYQFNQLFIPHSPSYIDRYYTYTESDGRRFATIDATQSGLRKGSSGMPWRGFDPASKGNHWKFATEELDRLDKAGRIYWPDKEGGWPRLKSYLDEVKGAAIQSIWTDIKAVNSQAVERTDYPTQKPEALLDRIIRASSNTVDLVLDCFVGCGTTAAVAQKLGRRWIAADINKGAIQTTSKRLQTIILEQAEALGRPRQGSLNLSGDEDGTPPPAALSFSVYRVNDYDLQVQHNEAVSLAVEHIGIQRTKTDVYFDGTLGRRLVKIVPFNHPLTLLDLQLLQDELKARPDEERDIVLVCLGKETAIDPWLEDYNKRHPVNKIEVIELRTDQKYGKFFVHQPAQAQVRIERRDGNIWVEIEDFFSPTIVERLEIDTPLFRAQIPDWRAMVDVVLIDTAYDGEIFDITLSDVPERKDDLVSGVYELPAPEGATTVAVKIVDMLGEEVLVKAEV